MTDSRFYRLLTSSFLSSMGDKFFAISLSWWILNESGVSNTGFMLGLVMAVTGIGTILFVPLLGSLADIYDRRKCMLLSMVGSILSLGALLATYQYLQHAPVIICSVSVILGVLTAFFMSSVQSSITFLVSPEHVTKAVSMAMMATPASQVIGASVAGFAIAGFGIRGSVSCDFCLYIAGFFLLLFSVPSFSSHKDDKKNTIGKQTYLQVLRGGVKYLCNEKALFNSLLFFACVNLFFSPILIEMPMIATTYFAGNSVALAMMEGCYSGGLILMSLFLNINKRKFNRHLCMSRSLCIIGLCFITIGIIHVSWLVYVMLFVSGAMLSLANVSIVSVYQIYVPAEMKGRFFSLMQVTVRAAAPIGFAMVGLLADSIGVREIVLINGIVIFVLSFVWLFLRKLDFNYTL